MHWVNGVLRRHLSALVLAHSRVYALFGVNFRFVTGFRFLVDVIGGVCLQPCPCWGFVPFVWGLKWVVEVVGCTAALLAYLSCVSCMCLERYGFHLRVLLRNECWLPGSAGCSVSSFGLHCCSMYDGGGNGGRTNKHGTGVLKGIRTSSIIPEPAVLVHDFEGKSSLRADCIPIASVVVLASGGTV